MNKFKSIVATLLLVLTTLTHRAYAQDIEGIVSASVQRPVLTQEEEKELLCLALNIYHEARGEPYEGRVAVAQVSVNRAKDEQFPDSICGVVKQKSRTREGRVVCQFSWYCTEKGKNIRPLSSEAFQESLDIARRVLFGGYALDSLREALYFHSRAIQPNWSKVRLARIGNHVFYKDPR